MIPMRTWVYIGCVIVALFAINHVLSGVYDAGYNDAKLLQDEANRKAKDQNDAEKAGIERDAAERLARYRAAADNAVANANGLRRQLDEVKRIAGNATGTDPASTTARDAVLLLADMLGQCSERYTRMAGFADAAHEAGRTCEASYDSLRKNPH